MKKYLSIFLFFLVFLFAFYSFNSLNKLEEINTDKTNTPLSEKSVSSTPEPIEYKSEDECWPDDGWSWREIGGCGNVRARVITTLAENEESKNKINLLQTNETPVFSKKFLSKKYGFSIYYPSDWKYESYNYEGFDTVNIYGPGKNDTSVEITIGTGQVYSTSGALCANQGCDYEGGSVEFNNGYKTTITKSYLFITSGGGSAPDDTKIEHYRFSLPLNELIKRPEKEFLYVTASFPDEETGNKILDILSTLKS